MRGSIPPGRLLSTCLIPALIWLPVSICPGEVATPDQSPDNIALHAVVSFETDPNYPRSHRGPQDVAALTDGQLAEGEGKMWDLAGSVGWCGVTPVVITVDLGRVESISGVGLHAAAGASTIQWPLRMLILVSRDGETYYNAGDLVALNGQKPPKGGYATHWFTTHGLQTAGRFVKLLIEAQGAARYFVADELEIWRGSASWTSKPPAGDPVKDAAAYFWSTGVERRAAFRIKTDIGAARQIVEASETGVSKEPFLNRLRELEAKTNDAASLQLPRNKAILPLNDLHRTVLAEHGEFLKALGLPALVARATNPWDYLDFVSVPHSGEEVPARVALMREEARPVAINLTNATPRPVEVHFNIEGFPPAVEVSNVYEIIWTDTETGTVVASAMRKLEPAAGEYTTNIPGGVTRQVWIEFKPEAGAKGRYAGKMTAWIDDKVMGEVPIEVKVHDLDFTGGENALHLGGWDFADGGGYRGITPQNCPGVIDLLQKYGVDRTWGPEGMISWGQYDADGNLITPPDMAHFDRWVNLWPHARQFALSLGVPPDLGSLPGGSPGFNRAVGQWADFLVKRVKDHGIRPDQLLLNLVDEPNSDSQVRRIVDWARAIKAAQSDIKIWVNPVYKEPEKAPAALFEVADILCPLRADMLRPDVREFYLGQKSAGKELELTSCAGPAKGLDPYTYYRLQAWTCFDIGGTGSSFWAFSDNGRGGDDWTPYMASAGSFTPCFLDAVNVTPGKAMEAIRAGAGDYEYLARLRRDVGKLGQRGGNAGLLKEGQDLLNSACHDVFSVEGATNFGWIIAKDRSAADATREKIGDWLEKAKADSETKKEETKK